MWEAENGGRWEGFSSAGGCLIQNPPTAFPLSSVQLIVGRKKEISLLTFTQYTHFYFFFLQRWWENPSVQLRAMEWTKRLKTALREITLLIWSNAENDSRLLLLDKKKPFYSRRNNDSSLWGAESEVISCYKNLSERKRLRSRIGCTKRVTPTGPCWFYL